jgi:hypothetical protein
VEDRMTARTIALVGLTMLAFAVTCSSDVALAAPVPAYYSDEWVGLLCVQATPPGSITPVPALLQINFDRSTNGGISLARADELFAKIVAANGRFGPLAGFTLVAQDCRAVAGPSVQISYAPNEIQAQFGVNALQVALALSGSFQGLGFQQYLILDSFLNLVPNYLTEPPVGVLPPGTLTLRTDLLTVVGNNDIGYVSSSEILNDLL